MSKHTPTPWGIWDSNDITIYAGPASEKTAGTLGGYRAIIAEFDDFNSDLPKTARLANARRITACVNAMEGLTNAEVKALRASHSAALEACEKALDALLLHGFIDDRGLYQTRGGCLIHQDQMEDGAAAVAALRAALAKAGGA